MIRKIIRKKIQKYLVVKEKGSNFALAFGNESSAARETEAAPGGGPEQKQKTLLKIWICQNDVLILQRFSAATKRRPKREH